MLYVRVMHIALQAYGFDSTDSNVGMQWFSSLFHLEQ